MLTSMTGFAKTDFNAKSGLYHWEVRCVNNRYFEPRIYLPDQFALFESSLREELKKALSRGRCDIYCRYFPQTVSEPLNINHQFAKALLEQLNELSGKESNYNIFDLLRWPGVLKITQQNEEEVQLELLQGFKSLLNQLIADRKREGGQIQQLLLSKLASIQSHMKTISERVPELIPLLKERLVMQLQQLKSEINQDRLEQEMVYLAHKMDVVEELDRFTTHLNEFKSVVEKGGAVGKRLDFLLQELQREINTLGNKCNDKLISGQVVDIKVLIEQLREQVQNVE